jgi:hypothetical protein
MEMCMIPPHHKRSSLQPGAYEWVLRGSREHSGHFLYSLFQPGQSFPIISPDNEKGQEKSGISGGKFVQGRGPVDLILSLSAAWPAGAGAPRSARPPLNQSL